MRVLIFGATGMLGQDLVSAFASDDVTGLSSKDADLRDASQILLAVQQARPNWIILSAAYADVDGCERDPARALAVNIRPVSNRCVAYPLDSSGVWML